MNLLTFLTKLKLKFLLLIVLMTLKSIWKKVLNLWHIYFLSVSKQETFKEFIEENLNMSFIWPTSSPHSAPVLFVKKKDSLLHLCIDFHSLNYISKKNYYLFLLISNILDSPHKACIYSKIDLCHVYHLVCITNGDKWKTAFRTCYMSKLKAVDFNYFHFHFFSFSSQFIFLYSIFRTWGLGLEWQDHTVT